MPQADGASEILSHCCVNGDQDAVFDMGVLFCSAYAEKPSPIGDTAVCSSLRDGRNAAHNLRWLVFDPTPMKLRPSQIRSPLITHPPPHTLAPVMLRAARPDAGVKSPFVRLNDNLFISRGCSASQTGYQDAQPRVLIQAVRRRVRCTLCRFEFWEGARRRVR